MIRTLPHVILDAGNNRVTRQEIAVSTGCQYQQQSPLRMNPVNLSVCLVYLLLCCLVVCLYKRSATESTPSLPHNKQVISTQSTCLTLSKFLFCRYTILTLLSPSHKKYILTQLLTVAVFSVSLLRLNRIMFTQLIASPLCLLLTLAANDAWIFRKKYRQEEEENQVAVQHRLLTMEPEHIIRAAIAGLTVGMLTVAAYRVNMSLSNLGELNILSVVIGVAIDQVAIRPCCFLLCLAAVKAAEAVVGASRVKEWALFKQIAIQECLKCQTAELYLEDVPVVGAAAEDKSALEKTSSPLKALQEVDRDSAPDSTSNEGTLADLLRMHSSIHKSSREEIKVEDIEISDKVDTDEVLPFDITSKDELVEKEEEEEMQMEDFGVLREHNPNQDLYLANIWGSQELDMPISIDNSPRPRKQKPKKRRVLVLAGNSPYLEYLPNMLKKQESENRIKAQSKSILNNKTNPTESRIK